MKQSLLDGTFDKLLFQDESMIWDYQAIARTWFPKGKQRIIPTYGKHHGVKLIGTLDYESGEVFCAHATHYDAEQFLAFLQAVLEHYPNQKIVMVLDNARIHHANLIQPFLQQNKAILELVFLPPYSPQFNPIEGLWGWLKKTCIYNVFYKSVTEIADAVGAFIQEINRYPAKTIDRLCLSV